MTNFIYISDTHLGANPMGFQQQQGYPKQLYKVTDALSEFITGRGDIDFVLHGGDMIDFTSQENLESARRLFGLPVPVYLCLGNHDLTTPDAAERWLEGVPAFFPGYDVNYTIKREDCLIHVMPNHWQDEPFYWVRDQRPHFKQQQRQWIERQLSCRTDLPHILLTHSPTLPVPQAQTGMDKPFHDPGSDFTNQISEIVSGKDHVKCVLGGHSHINMCCLENGKAYVTASALVETPFEFKLFEITSRKITMTTVSLESLLDVETVYNDARSYAQGRPQDRQFTFQF